MRDAAAAAAMSDPEMNRWFRRRWVEFHPNTSLRSRRRPRPHRRTLRHSAGSCLRRGGASVRTGIPIRERCAAAHAATAGRIHIHGNADRTCGHRRLGVRGLHLGVRHVNESTPARITLPALASSPLWVAWQTEMRTDGKRPTKGRVDTPGAENSGKGGQAGDMGAQGRGCGPCQGPPKAVRGGRHGLELASIGDGRHLSGIDLDTCATPKPGRSRGGRKRSSIGSSPTPRSVRPELV